MTLLGTKQWRLTITGDLPPGVQPNAAAQQAILQQVSVSALMGQNVRMVDVTFFDAIMPSQMVQP